MITLHDGFDPARVGERSPDEYRRKYNPDGRFVIQYAGNMGLSHPFETIIAAAQELRRDSSVRFQFVGDGPQRAIAESAIRGTQFIDYQPEESLGDMLAMSDVCLISQHDNLFDLALPYKIYSSLAARRPVIFLGNETSEVATLLRKHNAGIRVAQGDVVGLVQAIRRLQNISYSSDADASSRLRPACRRNCTPMP